MNRDLAILDSSEALRLNPDGASACKKRGKAYSEKKGLRRHHR
jgi:hypothetical protein